MLLAYIPFADDETVGRGRVRPPAACCPARRARRCRSTPPSGWAGRKGALIGGLAFIVPGLVAVLLIAALALGDAPPAWVEGFGAGAAAAVVAVVVQAGIKLIDPRRGLPYVVAGALGAVFAGPYVVAVLLLVRPGAARAPRAPSRPSGRRWSGWRSASARSYGGGYVIIPLMYGDAVEAQRWMTEQEFANAVAYGQITPGPPPTRSRWSATRPPGWGPRSWPR